MPETIENVAKFWDKHVCGEIYTPLTDRSSQEYFDQIRSARYQYTYHLKPFLQRVAASGPKVLEIGCSMGMDSAELVKLGCAVTGVDLSPASIEVARRHFEIVGLPIDLRVGNAEALEFADGAFDAVYSFGVLHHTPDIAKAIAQVHRVLRPGGKIFLMLYSRYSLNNLVHVLLRAPYESPRDWKVDAPVTMTFSKHGCRKLLASFSALKIQKRYLFGAGYRPVVDWIPTWANDALGRLAGWHWMIEGTKAS